MAKASKRVRAFQEKVDRSKVYPIDAALALLKEYATAKFNESIDVAVQLGVDPKKSDQVVRGSVVLPAGTGKTVRVAVFASGEKAACAHTGHPCLMAAYSTMHGTRFWLKGIRLHASEPNPRD